MTYGDALRLEDRINSSECPSWDELTAHAKGPLLDEGWSVLIWNGDSGRVVECREYYRFADSVREALQ